MDGSAIYGIDFTMPDLLHAAVEIAPVYGGKLVSVDSAAAEKMPGVKRVVRLDEAVAVVADSYWRARVALATLKPQFDDAGHGGVSTATIFEAFDKSLGAPPDMPAGAATVIKADYKIPFLPHATMEPMACTARVTGDRAEVWAGTQDPLNARKTAADALGFSPEQVQYTNLALGGGFGRKLPGYLDFVGMSARIAQGDVAGAGQDDLEPRKRHAARLLSPGGDDALRRRARRDRAAAGGAFVRMRVAATASRCSCRMRSPTRSLRRATPSIRFGPVRGDRCSTRSTASSRSRSSTRWRTRRGRIRSPSAAT